MSISFGSYSMAELEKQMLLELIAVVILASYGSQPNPSESISSIAVAQPNQDPVWIGSIQSIVG